MIQPVLRYVAKGEDVLLQVHNLPKEALVFSWLKSNNGSPARKLVEYNRLANVISWLPAEEIRKEVYENGSLLLQNVIESDAGMYTLEVLYNYFKTERANVEFYVKKSVTEPYVQITDTTVTGGTSVILTCVSPDTDVSIRWIFNNNNLELTEKMTLSPTKCGLRIDPVGREHFGLYQCEVSNHFSLQTSYPKEEEQQSLSSVLELRFFSSDGGQQVRRLMESSVLLCKGCTPWQRLLLTASLLTFWQLSTTARRTTVSVPPLVSEGDDVLFLVRNLPKDIKSLAWFKGQGNTTKKIATYTRHNDLSRRGLAYSNRETIYHNGSMLFEKVTLKDSGSYTLQTYNRHGKNVSTTSVILNVKAYLWKCGRLSTSSQPRIESVPPSVAEGRSVLLLVRNLPERVTAFLWFKVEKDLKKSLLAFHYFPFEKPTFWGPAYSGRETVNNDGSLLLHSVSQKDRGLYILRIVKADDEDEEAKVQLQVDNSLSAFCNALTPSQLMIQPVPRYAAEGEDVLLQVHNLPEEAQVISWLKSNDGSPARKFIVYNRTKPSISWGPAKRIRGKVYKTGSLLLQDIIESDAGMYTLEVLNKDSKIERANVEFYLKKPVTQPFVQITDTTVAGGDSVTFTCISPDTDVSIRWIFNNSTLYFTERMKLSPTKCGLRISPVKEMDSGKYQCEVSNHFSSKTSLPVSWP
ncbi:pregnancy-specific glycoprotein 22-like [Microtus oregoni]|uniref:pregnancy-specific glycoprotein 22-like n=1 Tax=Microtus oregoni TaxID=111838 RepID=UPI001BB1E49E|nr:pregnancy-specific glycoprotein 22-like [Microtus oregoni]